MQRVSYTQLELNPFTVFSEDAFLLTAGVPSSWNTMTAGWGGFGTLYEKPVAYVFVRESRYTYSFMEKNSFFTLSFFPREMKAALDFCGTHSGREHDKAKEAGLTPLPIDGSVAFEEANLVITCQKIMAVPLSEEHVIDGHILKSYPQGDWHKMFIGRVEGVYIP